MSHVTRKPVFGACSASDARQSLETLDIASTSVVLSKQRRTKMLIRLQGCAGWSASLLFACRIKKMRFCYDVAQMNVHVYSQGLDSTGVKSLYTCIVCDLGNTTVNKNNFWSEPRFFFYLGFTAHQENFTHFEAVNHKVGQKREIPEKNTWTPANRIWLVSHVTRTGFEPTALRWGAI